MLLVFVADSIKTQNKEFNAICLSVDDIRHRATNHVNPTKEHFSCLVNFCTQSVICQALRRFQSVFSANRPYKATLSILICGPQCLAALGALGIKQSCEIAA